jgi:hypothetical protein
MLVMASVLVSERRLVEARRRGLERVARWPVFLRDMAIVAGVIGLYFVVRGLAPDRIAQSVELTTWLIAIEQALHVYVEPQVQEISIRSHAVKEVANFIYAYLHFPVLAVVGAWLWWKGRDRFVFMRNVMFISMVIGVVFYYVLPAAPPRLMAMHGYDLGFVDTIFGGDTAVSYAQPSLIRNDYAAIPSFHFGWIALASAAIWVNTESRLLRGVAAALALAMTWAIVASANHLFIDMVLGGLVIAVSWYIATKLYATRASRNAPPPATIVALPLRRDRHAA